MSKIKTRPFDMVNYLNDEGDVAAYLQAVMEDGDPALLAAALGDIARARGMAQLAKDTGPVTRESVQKPVGRARSEHGHLVQSHARVGIQADGRAAGQTGLSVSNAKDVSGRFQRTGFAWPSAEPPIGTRGSGLQFAGNLSARLAHSRSHPLARAQKAVQQCRQIQVRVQFRKMQAQPRRRNFDVRKLRRPRAFQALRVVWLERYLQPAAERHHNASNTPVVTCTQCSRASRFACGGACIRGLQGILVNRHESLSMRHSAASDARTTHALSPRSYGHCLLPAPQRQGSGIADLLERKT